MKTEHQSFIIEMIKHGDKVKAYQKVYPNAGDYSARKSAERLMRIPEVAAELSEAMLSIQERAYTEAYQTCLEQQRTQLLSIMKKREILTQLATCQMKVGRYIKDEDGYRMVYEDPRPRDIIRAIEVDTRLEEACNRARNRMDPHLSQFDVYIDGRPCDNPNATPDPAIPQGLVMLPKKQDKEPQEEPQEEAEVTTGAEETPTALSMAREYIRETNTALQKDPMAKSFYKEFVHLRDNTPPPQAERYK